jgi:hypothetical protein
VQLYFFSSPSHPSHLEKESMVFNNFLREKQNSIILHAKNLVKEIESFEHSLEEKNLAHSHSVLKERGTELLIQAIEIENEILKLLLRKNKFKEKRQSGKTQEENPTKKVRAT